MPHQGWARTDQGEALLGCGYAGQVLATAAAFLCRACVFVPPTANVGECRAPCPRPRPRPHPRPRCRPCPRPLPRPRPRPRITSTIVPVEGFGMGR